MKQTTKSYALKAAHNIFSPQLKGSRFFAWYLILLFSVGMIHWIKFLDVRDIFTRIYDWENQYYYYSILKQAVIEGKIPFYISQKIQGTNQFLSIPETLLSPQILLAPFFNPENFILTNLLFLYGVGFLGSLLIMKRYHFSPFIFSVFFLLFNFNGYITSHIAVGHYMWTGYFFLPFYILFVMKIFEGDADHTTAIYLSLVMLGILLQGAVHIYIFSLLFLGILLLLSKRGQGYYLIAIFLSFLLGAFRLVPATQVFSERILRQGYISIGHFLNSFVYLIPDNSASETNLAMWEYDIYIGIVGLAFIILFGIIPIFQRSKSEVVSRYKELYPPIIVMTILTWGEFYNTLITQVPIPYLAAERVISRFVIIPFLFILLIACIIAQSKVEEFQNDLNEAVRAGLLLLTGAVFLAFHSIFWKHFLLKKPPSDTVDLVDVPFIISSIDSDYVQIVNQSALVSIFVLLGISGYLIWNNRKKRDTPKNKRA